MYLELLLPVVAAALVHGQGLGLGCPPPDPVLLSTTKSGVLPVLPYTPFPGVETLEGAIIAKGPPDPAYTPLYGPAPLQTNPVGITYQAVLPSTNFDDCTGSTVTGSITISSSSSGTGVDVSANFEGFPDLATYGPFLYHIHGLPVPADGNCTATLGHLDPQNAGEYYPCIVSAPQNCQVGDLAGKYGAITTSPFTAAYSDLFISTVAGSLAAPVSIVIHTANTTRLTCANFELVSGTGTSNGTASNATTSAVPSYSVVPSSEAGQVAVYGIAAVLTVLIAFIM